MYDLGPARTTFAVPVSVALLLELAQEPARAVAKMLHELEPIVIQVSCNSLGEYFWYVLSRCRQ